MTKSAWAWVWFAFLLALDIVIPWYALTNVQKISGAFFFWIVWVVVAIISVFFIFLRWRGVEK